MTTVKNAGIRIQTNTSKTNLVELEISEKEFDTILWALEFASAMSPEANSEDVLSLPEKARTLRKALWPSALRKGFR